MRILVNAIPMTNVLTGIARYLRNLYKALSSDMALNISYFDGRRVTDQMPLIADSARWQAAIRSAGRLPDAAIFGLRTGRFLKYEYHLNQVCKKKTPGLSVYHETAFTPSKMKDVPTVFSVYDLSLRRFRHTHPRDRVWLFEHFIKTRLRYARHVLTISEFVRQEIMEEFHLSPSMVSAVPLAPDPVFFPAGPDDVKTVRIKYGLPETYLLFVGSLEPRKNIDRLIDALMMADTDIPLVLSGWHGWGEKPWVKKIREGGLKNRIHLTGHIPDHDLRAIYTGAHAFVFPSLYEGFGLPILEAMSCRCPVICSNTASMPEVAGNAAILIDPESSDELASAIETLVYDTGIRTGLIEKGVRHAAGFHWGRTAESTLKIFKKVRDDHCKRSF